MSRVSARDGAAPAPLRRAAGRERPHCLSPNGAPGNGAVLDLTWHWSMDLARSMDLVARARPSKEEADGRAHRGRASLP